MAKCHFHNQWSTSCPKTELSKTLKHALPQLLGGYTNLDWLNDAGEMKVWACWNQERKRDGNIQTAISKEDKVEKNFWKYKLLQSFQCRKGWRNPRTDQGWIKKVKLNGFQKCKNVLKDHNAWGVKQQNIS